MKDTLEIWGQLFHEHRGTEMGVLCAEALRLGLKKGSITGDDLRYNRCIDWRQIMNNTNYELISVLGVIMFEVGCVLLLILLLVNEHKKRKGE